MKEDIQRQTKPRILKVEPLASTRVFSIEQVQLEFSNGIQCEYERFTQYDHGIVMIVPMLDEHTLLLIREYGVGVEDYVLTFPKGRVDPGETPMESAQRELQEEIGYKANDLQLMKAVTNAPGYSSTKMHIFLARGLEPSSLSGDEPEPLTVVPWSVHETHTLVDQKDFHEARAIAALYLLQSFLKNK